jgi:hypothetical protein
VLNWGERRRERRERKGKREGAEKCPVISLDLFGMCDVSTPLVGL